MENRIKRLEALKLLAEIRLIRYQSSIGTRCIEWLKAVSSLAGVITAVVAIGGLYFSFDRFQEEEKTKRIAYQTQQLNHSIELLSDTSTAKKLAGISAIESFMRTSDSTIQEQLLSVLINILSIEENKSIRDAIISSFKSYSYNNINEEIIKKALRKLVIISRSLVTQGELYNWRISRLPKTPELVSIEARAKSISETITILIRHNTNFSDFSGIYCVECDFSRLVIQKPDFSNAILYWADFSKSTMIGANFNGADIDRTSFVEADVRDGKFTLTVESNKEAPKTSLFYQLPRHSDKEFFAYHSPNFNCSNLQNANFSNFPIFGLTSRNAQNTYIGKASFIGADLENADFSSATMIGVKGENEGLPFPIAGELGGKRFLFWFGNNLEDSVDRTPYGYSLYEIKMNFSGANWDQAIMPKALADWLKENKPSTYMSRKYFLDRRCSPISKNFKPELEISLHDAIKRRDLVAVFHLLSETESKQINPVSSAVAARNFFTNIAYLGLINSLSGFHDKNDFAEMLKDFRTIGANNIVNILSKLKEINFEKLNPENSEVYRKSMEQQLLARSINIDKFEKSIMTEEKNLEELIWNHIIANQASLIDYLNNNKLPELIN